MSHPKASTAGSNLRCAKGARSLLLFVLPVVLLAVAVFAAPAQAAPTTIAEFGQGAGEVSLPLGTAIKQSSGNLYVAESGNTRVSKFDSAGNFLLAWGYGVADGTSQTLQTCGPAATPPTTRCFEGVNFSGTLRPQDVAVDQSSGDVYVADPSAHRVLKFTSSGQLIYMVGRNVNKTKLAEGGATQAEKNLCTAASGDTCGTGESGTGPNEFADPRSLAIEDSGPNAGRVWVGVNGRLASIEPAGTPGPEAALPGAGQTASLAIDSAANFYIVRPGADEEQQVNFSGFAEGDTFRLGNLPASCSVTQTGPIAYSGDFFTDAVQESLEEVCGPDLSDLIMPRSFSGLSGSGLLFFANQLAAQNVAQLTCVKLSGGGSCSVSTPEDGAPGTVEKRNSTGALLETLYTGAPEALALDAAGNIYLGDKRKYHFRILNPAGETTSVFGTGQVKANDFNGPQGNALALHEASGTLYSANTLSGDDSAVQAFPLPEPGPLPENQHVSELEPTTVTLAADLNPEGEETTYHFEWGTSESYGNDTPTEILPAEGFEAEAVEAELEELIPDTTYHFRLCAINADGSVCGEDTAFTTLPPVDIKAQWASDVTSTSAVLNAELDPLGVEAQWWIEYGTSDSYGQSTPESALPASFGEVAVATLFRDLTPGTTYHYRFVARDERDGNTYTVHGEDKAFTTQLTALGFELADGRAWEMVSPPKKFGALIKFPHPNDGGHLQAAADGNGLLYNTIGSIEAEPDGNRALEDSSVLARREGNGAWRSKDITLPHTSATDFAVGGGREYKLLSTNLERALLEPRDATPHSPAASERTPYLRENTEPATYTPLVSGKEGFANVPPGTEFGGDPLNFSGAVRVTGATPDLGQVVLQSSVPLAAGAPPAALYRWAAGQLEQASVLPGEGGATVGAQLGSGAASLRKAISDDGSRLFWSTSSTPENANPGTLTGLYLRDMERGETVRLDVVQPGSFGLGEANPVFMRADPEGTVALFTDSRQLTEDANEEGHDLYRCQITVEGGELGCELTNLTAETAGAGESAEVQGLLPGMSEDARRAYFVANGVLDPAPNGEGDSAVSGQPNLYLWQEGAGTRFIATLASADRRSWASQPGVLDRRASELAADASPSGRYLTFMSERSLTGYDNREAAGGEAAQEVFRYDAASDELICASCNPAGARPGGLRGNDGLGQSLVDPQRLWEGRMLAAVLPQATRARINAPSLYRPRAIHDNGRLFFNAADSLVPADSNGQWDVYQYEPTGTGDCTASSGGASIARSAGGCVSLISSGTGEEESAFLDASVGGEDVFFYTSEQLSVTDEDEEIDVYDARVDGVAATLDANAECLGEACQPPASAPNDPTPASAAFRGQGNVVSAQRRSCGAIARRTGKLSRQAKRLRRKAKRTESPRASKRMQRRAKRLSRKASGLGKRAKRCRRANRRAAR